MGPMEAVVEGAGAKKSNKIFGKRCVGCQRAAYLVVPQLGKQSLRTEFRYQSIISYRVVEAFEPLDLGSCQLCFVLLGEDFL